MQILCPGSLKECEDMLRWAVSAKPGPIALRYPRGGNRAYDASNWKNGCETVCVHREGKDLTIVTYGVFIDNVLSAARILAEQGIEATVLRIMRVNPLNMKELVGKFSPGNRVFIAEEVSGNCGLREHIASLLNDMNAGIDVSGVDLGNQYISHGAIDKLYDYYGLSPEKLAQTIMEVHSSES